VTTNITVTPVDAAPVVTTTSSTLSYTELTGALAIDPGLTISDVDNLNLTGATISVAANYAPEDSLNFTPQNGITIVSNSVVGGVLTLTLTGTSSVANYQTALESVTYTDSSNDPNTLPRTVSFVVSDGQLNSAVATRTISVVQIDQAPVITYSGGSQTAGVNTPLTFNPANSDLISLSDVDANSGQEQVTLSTGPNAARHDIRSHVLCRYRAGQFIHSVQRYANQLERGLERFDLQVVSDRWRQPGSHPER
jgi:hypothetical protein